MKGFKPGPIFSTIIGVLEMVYHSAFLVGSCMVYSTLLFPYLLFNSQVTPPAVHEATNQAAKIMDVGHSSQGQQLMSQFGHMASLAATASPIAAPSVNDTTLPSLPLNPIGPIFDMIIGLVVQTGLNLVSQLLSMLLLTAVAKASEKCLLVYIIPKGLVTVANIVSCIMSLYQDGGNSTFELPAIDLKGLPSSGLDKLGKGHGAGPEQLMETILQLVEQIMPFSFTIYVSNIVWSVLSILSLVALVSHYKELKAQGSHNSFSPEMGDKLGQ